MTLAPANSHGSGYPLGLTGAIAATRYVGGTTSGAPVAGTFAVGDFIIDETGKVYICTVAGTPGTWTQSGGSGTPPGGSGYTTGRYVGGRFVSTGAGSIAAEAVMYAIPILVHGSFTADRITVYQVAAGAAGAVVRLGIYNDNGNVLPGTRLLDAGTYDATTGTNVAKEITISQALTSNVYWLVAVIQGGAVSRPSILSCSAGSPAIDYLTDTALFGNLSGFSVSSISGALPTPFGSPTAASLAVPMIWLRAA